MFYSKLSSTCRSDLFPSLHKHQLGEVQRQLQEAQQKLKELNLEQIALLDILQEERERQDETEERLREKLRVRRNSHLQLLHH